MTFACQMFEKHGNQIDPKGERKRESSSEKKESNGIFNVSLFRRKLGAVLPNLFWNFGVSN